MAKTFLEILTSVKNECRVKASDNLDDWIKDVINQELRLLCANAEYPELLVPNAPLTIASAEQSQFALPVGVRQIVAVEFALDGTTPSWRPLVQRNAWATSLTIGNPNWWYRAGNSIHVFPYTSIVTTNAIRITYYKLVTSLVADGDLMEIGDLEEPLIQRVNARVLRYHNDKQADAHLRDSVAAETRVVQ